MHKSITRCRTIWNLVLFTFLNPANTPKCGCLWDWKKQDLNLIHRETTYWSPHLVYSTFSKYMVGPRSLLLKPHKVWKYNVPDLKALMCVKLREKNQECSSFLNMCCNLLKNGVFDENQVTHCVLFGVWIKKFDYIRKLNKNYC